MGNMVEHPDHYSLPGLDLEAIDVIRSVLGSYGFRDFCRGNTIKYVLRANKKGGTEDLKKAIRYLEYEISERESMEVYTDGSKVD